MSYKYYILENHNQNVQGVISDDDGKIVYEDLMVKPLQKLNPIILYQLKTTFKLWKNKQAYKNFLNL